MRFRELFDSDYSNDLRSEVITLLTAISAEGLDEVSTQSLLIDLEEQGFAIDEQTLLDLLDNIDIVSTANADNIQIATTDTNMMVGRDAEEIEADHVNNMATKQATDDIGSDL